MEIEYLDYFDEYETKVTTRYYSDQINIISQVVKTQDSQMQKGKLAYENNYLKLVQILEDLKKNVDKRVDKRVDKKFDSQEVIGFSIEITQNNESDLTNLQQSNEQNFSQSEELDNELTQKKNNCKEEDLQQYEATYEIEDCDENTQKIEDYQSKVNTSDSLKRNVDKSQSLSKELKLNIKNDNFIEQNLFEFEEIDDKIEIVTSKKKFKLFEDINKSQKFQKIFKNRQNLQLDYEDLTVRRSKKKNKQIKQIQLLKCEQQQLQYQQQQQYEQQQFYQVLDQSKKNVLKQCNEKVYETKNDFNIEDAYNYQRQLIQHESNHEKEYVHENIVKFDKYFDINSINYQQFSEFFDQKQINNVQMVGIQEQKDENNFEKNKQIDTTQKIYKRIYEIQKLLQKGRDSSIFEGYFIINADNKNIKQKCILKIFKKQCYELFAQEVKIYELLKNTDNIIKYIDHLSVGNHHILIIERGKYSLSQQLQLFQKNKIKFTIDRFQQMISDLLDGLIQIRKKRILHQDIKLQNIVLTENLIYCFIDFEISSQISEQGLFKQIGFTKEYASPEQKCRGIIGYKSDVYCLGKTLLEIIKVFKKMNPIMNLATQYFISEFQNIIEKFMVQDEMQQRKECHEIHQLFFNLINTFEYLDFNLNYLSKINQLQYSFENDENKDEYSQNVYIYYATLKQNIQKLHLKSIQNATNQNQDDANIQQINQALLSISEQSTYIGNLYRNLEDFYTAYQYYLDSYQVSQNLIFETDPNQDQNIVNLWACYDQAQKQLQFKIFYISLFIITYIYQNLPYYINKYQDINMNDQGQQQREISNKINIGIQSQEENELYKSVYYNDANNFNINQSLQRLLASQDSYK